MRPSAAQTDILSLEKFRLLSLLERASMTTKLNANLNQIPDEDCLTEFGQKTLGEFLRYILDLKLKNKTPEESIFSEEQIKRLLEDAELTDKDLSSRQFFHNFLLEFHEKRASYSSKTDDQTVKNLAANQSFLNKNAGQKLSYYQTTSPSEKYNADTTGEQTFNQIEVYYSETVGERRTQEDSFIIGSAKEGDWQDSKKVPSLLEKKFADLGPKIRSFGDQITDGSTAIISHYSTDQKLTIANLGDSRAVLFIKKGDGSFDWIRLTNDQEPLDILEMARIEGNGGFVPREGLYKNRVNGTLMIARSFGDHGKNLEGIEANSNTPNGKKLISYQPDIYQYNIPEILKEKHGSQAFLMTSCDGMYDHGIGNEATYANLLKVWFKNENLVQTKWGNNVAEYLRDYAIVLGSKDNVTVCFSNITNAPTEPMVVGVFDGHGGCSTSSIIAESLGQDLLKAGAIIHYAGGKNNTIRMVDTLQRKTLQEENKDIYYPTPNPVTRIAKARPARATPTAVPQIINYEINENTQTIKINSITSIASIILLQEDYDNLYDVEFAPIIEFYKNGGKVECDTSINNNEYPFTRIVPNSRYTTPIDQNSFQTLKESLSKITQAKQTFEEDYLEHISQLETDDRGYITQESFFRHGRKNRGLPGLTTNDVDGRYWYSGGSIDLVNKAYVLDAGFKSTDSSSNLTRLYEKDGNLIFLGQENCRDIGEAFKAIKNLSQNKKAQIFIPINRHGTHWETLEIEVERGSDDKFSIQNSYYDPLGTPTVYNDFKDLINKSAEKLLGTEKIKSSTSKTQNASKQSDCSSCGPVSCWYVGQRAGGKDCFKSTEQPNFAPGALDLRLAQIRLVSKNIGSQAQNLHRCYNKPRPLATTATPTRTIPVNTSDAQSKCKEILLSLSKVSDTEFGATHSFVREIFSEELEKFKDPRVRNAATTLDDLFANAGQTANREFVIVGNNALTEAINAFKIGTNKGLEFLSKLHQNYPAEKIFLTDKSGKEIEIEKAAIKKLGSVFKAAFSSGKIPREKRKELFSELKELAIQGLSTKALIATELDKKTHEKVTLIKSVNFNEKSETAEKIKVGEKNITVETGPKADSSGKLKIKFGERYVRKEFSGITFVDSSVKDEEFGDNSFANCNFIQCDLFAIKGKTIKFANCTFDKDCTLPFDLETLETIGFSGCKFSETLVKSLSSDIQNKIGIEGAPQDGFYSNRKVQYIPKSDLWKARVGYTGSKPQKPSTIPFTSGLNTQLRATTSERTAS